ncbi:MAG: T9SS type A sorting domain-containing protein, partial [Bacteroidetes bacterium]|nr:T9SS type A sorting domain-containing protein [Bacteroidota bacterium]
DVTEKGVLGVFVASHEGKILNIGGFFSNLLNPSVAPDSSFNADGYGGLLVAWNSASDSLGIVRHQVQTNKLEYVTTGGATIQWSNANIINASEFCADTTWPDIARISNLSGSDTMAYIVYEGITEICTPSRSQEVLGQFVFYNTYGPYARGAQFDSPFSIQGRQVAPGEGYYTQSQPIVQTSVNNTVSIYWIDGRGSKDLVMGTRSYADTSMLYWLKRGVDDDPARPIEVVLEGSYPNPLYLHRSSISHVVVQTTAESTAKLVLYDNLGREVVTIHHGPLPAGRNVIRFDAGSLRTGVYHYALIQGENVTIRGLIVVR